MTPMSPGVQPAVGVDGLAVAASSSKYPTITLNPRHTISPGSPRATSAPSSSTILTSTPSMARPDVCEMVSGSSSGRQIDTVPVDSVSP